MRPLLPADALMVYVGGGATPLAMSDLTRAYPHPLSPKLQRRIPSARPPEATAGFRPPAPSAWPKAPARVSLSHPTAVTSSLMSGSTATRSAPSPATPLAMSDLTRAYPHPLSPKLPRHIPSARPLAATVGSHPLALSASPPVPTRVLI